MKLQTTMVVGCFARHYHWSRSSRRRTPAFANESGLSIGYRLTSMHRSSELASSIGLAIPITGENRVIGSSILTAPIRCLVSIASSCSGVRPRSPRAAQHRGTSSCHRRARWGCLPAHSTRRSRPMGRCPVALAHDRGARSILDHPASRDRGRAARSLDADHRKVARRRLASSQSPGRPDVPGTMRECRAHRTPGGALPPAIGGSLGAAPVALPGAPDASNAWHASCSVPPA